MPKIDTSSLKAMLAQERSSAMAAIEASKLSNDRSDAMDYYLGDMSKDMPAAEGRSQAVSTDVASFIKDALLSKVGIVKIWWEEREEEQRESYYDLSEDQFALLAQAVAQSNGAMEIVEHTARPMGQEA
jgi:hypothetical protein